MERFCSPYFTLGGGALPPYFSFSFGLLWLRRQCNLSYLHDSEIYRPNLRIHVEKKLKVQVVAQAIACKGIKDLASKQFYVKLDF